MGAFPGGSGQIWYQLRGDAPHRMLVIEYYDMCHISDDPMDGGGTSTPWAHYTFEVILFEGSNSILFQYKEMLNGNAGQYADGRSATVGIENPAGNGGLRYSYNQVGALYDGLTILFTLDAANEPPWIGSPLLVDDFDDNNDDGWTDVFGTFSAAGQQYVHAAAGPVSFTASGAWVGSTGWTDYTAEVTARDTDPDFDGYWRHGIMVRYTDENNYVWFHGAGAPDNFYVYQRVGGVDTLLWSGGTSGLENTYYTYTVDCYGDQFSFYVQGGGYAADTLLTTQTITAPVLQQGAVRLGSWSELGPSNTEFDDVRVYERVPDLATQQGDTITFDLSDYENDPEDLSGARYKRLVAITPPTTVADYQVRVDIGSDFNYSHTLANGDDVRFYDMAMAPLDYWIESWNPGGSSVIWVEVPTIGTSQVQMLYGDRDPGISGLSDADATFDFFDDFDDGVIDVTKWQNVASASEAGGSFRGDGGNGRLWANTIASFNAPLAVDFSMQKLVAGDFDSGIRVGGLYFISDDGPGNLVINNGWAYPAGSATDTNFHHYTATVTNGLQTFSDLTSGYNAPNAGYAFANGQVYLVGDSDNAGRDTYYDWISVRKYASPESLGVLGAEETIGSTGLLAGWSHRKPVSVQNPGASDLEDFQVQVDVTWDADMQPDFDDIRFTMPDGKTHLDHWRETFVPSTSATFWVKIPTIPASGSVTMYMYYGNGAAASASDIDATMDQGLRYYYYDGTNFNTYLGTDVDTDTDHAWDSGWVRVNGNPWESQWDTASIRWEGWVKPEAPGNHQFRVTTDDGSRLWVNGTQIINAWWNQGPTLYTAWYSFNEPVPIRYDWYENTGGANAQLGWDPPVGGVELPIPSSHTRCRKYANPAPSVAVGDEEATAALPASILSWFVTDADPTLFSSATVDTTTDVLELVPVPTAFGNDDVQLVLVDSDGVFAEQWINVRLDPAPAPWIGIPIFEDDFDDGNMAGWNAVDDGWIDAPSNWDASSQELVESSNIYGGGYPQWPGTYAWAGDTSWKDYSFEANVRSTDNDGIGLMGRYQDANNYYRFHWDSEDGRDLHGGTGGTQHRVLAKKVAGAWTYLAWDSVQYDDVSNPWYNVRMDFYGDQISVHVDGVEIFSVTDTSLASGAVGLYSWANSNSGFDDVRVFSKVPDLFATDQPTYFDLSPYENSAAFQPRPTLIAVADDNGHIYHSEVQPDGTMSNLYYIGDIGQLSRAVATGDFDNDGDYDIVAAASNHAWYIYLYYFENTGTAYAADFSSGSTYIGQYCDSTYISNNWAMDMAVADFNNDGNLDVTIGGNYEDSWLLFGDGGFGFTSQLLPRTPYGVTDYSRGMDAGDVDGDGDVDLIKGINPVGFVYLYENMGDGTEWTVTYLGDVGDDPYGITLADFNNDGWLDIIGEQGNSGNPYLALGNGDGSFGGWTYVASLDTNRYTCYDAFDLDNDGNQDVVATDYDGQTCWFYPGNGDGTFGARSAVGVTNVNTLAVGTPPLPPGSGELTWSVDMASVDPLLISAISVDPVTDKLGITAALGAQGTDDIRLILTDIYGGTDSQFVTVDVLSLPPPWIGEPTDYEFSDDFNDGNYNGWTIVDMPGAGGGPSLWSVSGGALRQASNINGASGQAWPGTYAWGGDTAWTDYTIDLDMRSTDNDGIGVMFRYSDANNYYRFHWHSQNRDVDTLLNPGTQRRVLDVCVGGVWTVLASDNVPYASGQWYNIEIQCTGSYITVSVDGVRVFAVLDTSVDNGAVALYSWGNQDSYFDNVWVHNMYTPVPTLVVQAGPTDFDLTRYENNLLDIYAPYSTLSAASQETSFAAWNSEAVGCLATDGTYVYSKSWSTYDNDDQWITKIGTGYGGTTAGQDYGDIAYTPQRVVTMFYLDGYLYHPNTTASWDLIKVNVSTGWVTTQSVPDGLIIRDTGLVAFGAGGILVTTDGTLVYNVAYSIGNGGYNGFTVRVFDPLDDWSLVREFTSGTASFYTDGIVCDGVFLYFVEWTGNNAARVRAVDCKLGTFKGEWTIDQGTTTVISGQYDWVNNKIWMGDLVGSDIYRYPGRTENYLDWSAASVDWPLASGVITDNFHDTLTLTPSAGAVGTDDILLTLTDSRGMSDSQWVEVIVNAQPTIDPAVPDLDAGIHDPLYFDLSPYENDLEDSGADLTWAATQYDPALTSSISIDPVTDVVTIESMGLSGQDDVLLVLTDSLGGTAEQWITITYSDPPWIGTTLFEDDFSDGVDDGWTDIDNTFSVVGGEYQHFDPAPNSYTNTGSFAGDDSWTDYTASVTVRDMDPDANGHWRNALCVRYRDENNYVMFHGTGDPDIFVVYKRVGGVFTNLWSGGASGVEYRTYTYSIEAYGNEFSFYVSGPGYGTRTLLTTQTINDAMLQRGAICLKSWADGNPQSQSVFDNVRVYTKAPDMEVEHLGANTFDLTPYENDLEDGEYTRTITLTPATPVADFEVKVVLNTGNFDYAHAMPNGADLKFFDEGANKLSHWIESWNPGGTSVIWVKVPTAFTSTIYMSYGSDYAFDESDGTATFGFFDDFDDGVIDPDKWPTQSLSGLISENGGELVVTRAATNVYIRSPQISAGGIPLIVEARTRTPSVPANGWTPVMWYQNGNEGASVLDHNGGGGGCQYVRSDSGWYYMGASKPLNEWHVNQLNIYSTGAWRAEAHWDTSTWADWQYTRSNGFAGNYYLAIGPRGDWANYNQGMDGRVDWVRVRKYASVEPVASVGVETSNSPGLTWSFLDVDPARFTVAVIDPLNDIVEITPTSVFSTEDDVRLVLTDSHGVVYEQWITLSWKRPQILATSPFHGETDFPIISPVVVNFSRPMDPDTLTFTCNPDPGNWTVEWDETFFNATFHHKVFDTFTSHTFRVHSVRDQLGLWLGDGPVSNPFVFTTGDAMPYIVDASPSSNPNGTPREGVDVSPGDSVWVRFSHPINTYSFAFTCTPDPGGWEILWNDNGSAVTLNHDDFVPDTVYTFEVVYAEDLKGTPLAARLNLAPNPWSFLVNVNPFQPIIEHDPPDGIAAGQWFILDVTVTDDNEVADVFVQFKDSNGTQTNTSLEGGPTYTVLLPPQAVGHVDYSFWATDVDGWAVRSRLYRVPVLEDMEDTVDPFALHTSPADGEQNVSVDAELVAEMSEPMSGGMTQVIAYSEDGSAPGIPGYSEDGNAITYSFLDSLAYGANYTVIITAQDLAGNRVTFSFSFSTEQAPASEGAEESDGAEELPEGLGEEPETGAVLEKPAYYGSGKFLLMQWLMALGATAFVGGLLFAYKRKFG